MEKDIDHHKLMYHPERVSEWIKKGDCFPIYIEMGLTNFCNQKCIFCALDFLDRGRVFINREVALSTIQSMGFCGVKSLMFAGEGESTLHPNIGEFVKTAKSSGIDTAITTNGVFFTPEKIESCLPSLSWIRFSVDAGTAESYSKIHKCSEKDFYKVLDNISYCVNLKKKKNLETTIGIQLLLIPQNKNELENLISIAKEIGVDNLQIKPYSHHPKSKNNFSLEEMDYREIKDKIKNTDLSNIKVIFRELTLERIQSKKPYKKCLGASFIGLIDAKGNVFPCNLFYGDETFYYGNIYEQSFEEIWSSDRRKKVLEKLGVSEGCREGCRLDAINNYLWRLKNPELHDNFI